RTWTSNHQRARALDTWLRRYNTQRGHSALGGHPPISRLA
ncbi:MAG TPA: integrase core domain-containing protein, partial [Frankiaceae bacterium]|nr:integrase core domain-containing protein [Frankiaceae bacterium]HVF04507.1 integrase core domain-containing protein [Frankiaceae bacterium]